MSNEGMTERTSRRRREIKDEERARLERIDRLFEELHESMRKSRAIIDEWRAKGILSTEEPRRRV